MREGGNFKLSEQNEVGAQLRAGMLASGQCFRNTVFSLHREAHPLLC